MSQCTIQRTCHQVGMESNIQYIYFDINIIGLFHTGCISSMAWELSTSAKFAVITVTGEEELSKDISKNGDMLMV